MTLGEQVIYDDGWTIPDQRALRRDKIGFVFQAPYLIPFLDVTDNVALLPMLAGRPIELALDPFYASEMDLKVLTFDNKSLTE